MSCFSVWKNKEKEKIIDAEVHNLELMFFERCVRERSIYEIFWWCVFEFRSRVYQSFDRTSRDEIAPINNSPEYYEATVLRITIQRFVGGQRTMNLLRR